VVSNKKSNEFRSRLDHLYHKFDSPLERLDFLDMGKQFPLDYIAYDPCRCFETMDGSGF
jgi:hypothetical protein